MASIIKNNIVFLHIPKTGGSWIKKVLTDEGLLIADTSHEHSTYDYFAASNAAAKKRRASSFVRRKRRARFIENPKFFCVVRNPIAWYESWYKFEVARKFETWGERGNPQRWHVMSALNELVSDDFNASMERINDRYPGFVTSLYSMYTTNSRAEVIRLENVHDELSAFFERNGIDVGTKKLKQKPKENVSPGIDLTWDSELEQEIIKNERGAFVKYGYEADLT